MARGGNSWQSSAQVARLVRQCLAEGVSVEMDGLGTFLPDAQRGFRFLPRIPKRILRNFLTLLRSCKKVQD